MDSKNIENEKFTIPESQEYYKKTIERIKEIESSIDQLEKEGKTKNDEEKNKGINDITNIIKTERENFYNTIDFLASYDKTLYSKMYDELLEKVNKVKNIFFPKKKFAFSSKVLKTSTNSKQNSIPEKENKNGKNEVIQEGDPNDLIIKNISNQKITYDINDEQIKNKNNVIIENLSNCQLYLLFNFKACYIKTIENSKIFIGSVSGGSHITNSHNSEIYIASHQLRIHDTQNTKFFVLTNSNPIIEKSTNNTFYPLKISYSNYIDNINKAKFDLNNNKWNQVQDFQWLKKEKSPNFETNDNNECITL